MSITIRNEKDLLEFLEADTREQAERHVYKYTDCGAWIKFRKGSVELGSIVEGSDADITTTPLKYPFTSDDYDQTMRYIEAEADIAWLEANWGGGA